LFKIGWIVYDWMVIGMNLDIGQEINYIWCYGF